MEFEFDSDELDIETAVELLNELARKTPEGRTYPPEMDWQDLEKLHPLAYKVADAAADRVTELFEGTTYLSEEEAHIVALKELGLTHHAISVKTGLDSEGIMKSTVDEYSRRARQKYLKAKRTVDELEELYGGEDG